LGEFPTGHEEALENARWKDSELRALEDSPERYLFGRLRLARQRGYAGALAWATQPEWLQERAREKAARTGERAPHDPRVAWGASQREQLRKFAHGEEI
jgi:hypothetical protein